MTSVKDPLVRRGHIQAEIDGVRAGVAGRSATEVFQDAWSVRAIERAIQVISEAAKELPAHIRAMEPDVPWTEIIAIGNYLRHEYFRIDRDTLAEIVTRDLPALALAVGRLVARLRAVS